MRKIRLSKRAKFRHLRGISKPALVVYGNRDEYCYGNVSWCVEILADAVGPNFEFAVIDDSDHGFTGHEEELTQLMIDWLLRDDR